MMIHSMQMASETDKILLQSLLAQRREAGNMSVSQKQLVLELMRRLGSMEYTAKILTEMLAEVDRGIRSIEETVLLENKPFHSILRSLSVETAMP
jgi:geranylgeranyl pyrophosphate synthase